MTWLLTESGRIGKEEVPQHKICHHFVFFLLVIVVLAMNARYHNNEQQTHEELSGRPWGVREGIVPIVFVISSWGRRYWFSMENWRLGDILNGLTGLISWQTTTTKTGSEELKEKRCKWREKKWKGIDCWQSGGRGSGGGALFLFCSFLNSRLFCACAPWKTWPCVCVCAWQQVDKSTNYNQPTTIPALVASVCLCVCLL